MPLNRRRFVAAAALAGLGTPLPFALARGQGTIEMPTPEGTGDQTTALQTAIHAAAAAGRPLALAAGTYRTRTLRLPADLRIEGVAGATRLVQAGSEALVEIADADNIVLSGLVLDGADADGTAHHGGLVDIRRAQGITLRDCTVRHTRLNGISIVDAAARIENCHLHHSALTGLFALDSRGVIATGNRIHSCANGGIRVWRGENGDDGSILTGNRIDGIGWSNGGNGQNGNGINVFRADSVIVADNHISDCAFTAVRLNATNNTQVRGNVCLGSGEVAIFSEFAFSGSVIANNIVDGAAAGISMTNYIDGGRLAVCSGNIVRNILPSSPVNPDTIPYGIAAEADAVLTGNLVENVPGTGLLIGWGPYLRDVSATGNVIRDTEIGIAVSVAEGAGAAMITENLISGAASHAIAASRWWDIESTDLESDAPTFPQLTVRNNTVL